MPGVRDRVRKLFADPRDADLQLVGESLHFVYHGSESPRAWGIDIPFDPQLLPRYRATSLRHLEGQLDGRRAFVFECKSAMTKEPSLWWLLADSSEYFEYSCIAVSAVLPVEDCALLGPSQDDLAFGPSRYGFDRTVLLPDAEPWRVALNHAPLFEPPDWFAGAFVPEFTEWLGTKRGVHFRLTPDWLLCVTPYGTHKGQGWADVGLQIKTAAAFLRRIGQGG